MSQFTYTIHGKDMKPETREALLKTLELAAKQFLKGDYAASAKKAAEERKLKRKFNYDRF